MSPRNLVEHHQAGKPIKCQVANAEQMLLQNHQIDQVHDLHNKSPRGAAGGREMRNNQNGPAKEKGKIVRILGQNSKHQQQRQVKRESCLATYLKDE